MSVPRRAVVPSEPKPAAPASGPSPGRSLGCLSVRCRYCGAPPGQPCIDKSTNKPRPGGQPHGWRERDPWVLRWNAWHGYKEASRAVPPV